MLMTQTNDPAAPIAAQLTAQQWQLILTCANSASQLPAPVTVVAQVLSALAEQVNQEFNRRTQVSETAGPAATQGG